MAVILPFPAVQRLPQTDVVASFAADFGQSTGDLAGAIADMWAATLAWSEGRAGDVDLDAAIGVFEQSAARTQRLADELRLMRALAEQGG